jgi:tRNA pseudouridine38-40 synthase
LKRKNPSYIGYQHTRNNWEQISLDSCKAICISFAGISELCCKKKVVRYFLKLSYNGKKYNGWQSQQNAPSVQDEIEKCLSYQLHSSIRLTGCGRTDAGVHARNFYAHFDCDEPVDLILSNQFQHKLNHCLTNDIAIEKVIPVCESAHARFDAISRTYHYQISRAKNPFTNESHYYVYGDLNVDAMQRCASILLEYEDFTSFSKLHSQTKTNLCNIHEAVFLTHGNELVFHITANRFLRNMVRAITGTLLEVGKGKLNEADFRTIIDAKDRNKAGFSVPAHALYLQEVRFPETIWNL